MISKERPWLKYLSQTELDIPLPQRSMYEHLVYSNSELPTAIALRYYGTEITYGELIQKIDEYAEAFTHAGIQQGEYVSFYTVSIPESIYAMYALNKIGAVCNLIDVRTDASHTAEFIKKAKSTTLIVLDLFVDKIADKVDELGLKRVIIQQATASLPAVKKIAKSKSTKKAFNSELLNDYRFIRNETFLKSGKGTRVRKAPYAGDAPAVVVRTGGTTGISKGVVLTNDAVNAESENMRASMGSVVGESVLNFLPFAASYGIVVGIHVVLTLSGINILIPNFSPDNFGNLVLRYKPNHIVGVPVFYENLMNNIRVKNKDLSYLITMAAGGDTANSTLESRLKQFRKDHNIRHPLATGYGMSEVASACAYGVNGIHKPGSVGIPAKFCNISIFEPGTTNELGYNEVGEVCISGKTLMKEYLDEPEETANVMWQHPDGEVWVHSGDLGVMDEDGFLYIKGRIKRSIIRFDGHKNYPVQIEGVIEKHPAVENSAVIGVKDSAHAQGELPLAVVQLRRPHTEEGIEPEPIDEDVVRKDILQFCKDNLELRSQPCDVVLIDTMPLTANGKVDITKLMSKYKNYRA